MSADNGIYIAKFPDGFRVTHAQAIENIGYFPPNTKERKTELRRYFGKSKIYPTFEEARKQAFELAKDWDYLEYGICYVGEYESFCNPSCVCTCNSLDNKNSVLSEVENDGFPR